MPRWTSSLHPRAGDGKFKGKAGGQRRQRLEIVGGNAFTGRYNRMPTRGETAATVAGYGAVGAVHGGLVGGPAGALVAGTGLAAGGAAIAANLRRRTKKHGVTYRA